MNSRFKKFENVKYFKKLKIFYVFCSQAINNPLNLLTINIRALGSLLLKTIILFEPPEIF